MARRLNDTAALSGPKPLGRYVDQTISCREIDNGYVVSTSEYNSKTGEYRRSECFSQTPPKVTPGQANIGASPDGPLSLRDCMQYMRDGE